MPSLDALCEHDEVAAATLTMFARRMQRFDPAMLGPYAEHLVACQLGGRVNEAGYGPVDVVWQPPEFADGAEIQIQVKAARAFRTFADGIVDNVSFSTRASRDLADVWAQKAVAATRAEIWIFALHGGESLSDRWRFFVVAGSKLDELGQSTISLNALSTRFGAPLAGHELAAAVLVSYRDRATAPRAQSLWSCRKCEKAYLRLSSLAAH